jgi:hypothetical protein
MRTGHGLATDADWLWTGHGHGLAMDLNLDVFEWTRRVHRASILRPLRGHRILRWLRGRAYLGIKHDKNLIASAVE